MLNVLLNVRFFVFFIILFLRNEVQGQCTERANQPSQTVSSPFECATEKYVVLTKPITKASSGYPQSNRNDRTNSIQDFCVLTDMFGATAPTPQDLGFAPKDCYPYPPKPGSSPPVDHSAGPDPNWAILQHLVQHKAQSFQPHDDLPWTDPHLYNNQFFIIDESVKPEPLPEPLSPNPYFIEVTGVSMKGELLHNFLHFRIFANLSVALGKDQAQRSRVLHGRGQNSKVYEYPNYSEGRISAALIMVKDQDGWPVGDFSTAIPCDRTCKKYSHDVYHGDERNAVPCGFTPPFASTHPGMFVYDADPGRYCTKAYFNGTASSAANPMPPDPRESGHTGRLEGVRELHATWSFGHSTCNFVERLYIQTLVFEDVETVYSVAFRNTHPLTYDNWVLFGWSAQYNILKTRRTSLGHPDYVDLKYFRERDARVNEIDCHVPLFDAPVTVASPFEKFSVPSHENILDTTTSSLTNEIKVPSRLGYLASLTNEFVANKDIRYFGHHGPKYPNSVSSASVCRPAPKNFILSDVEKKVFSPNPPERISKFLLDVKNEGVRCPCPALASTLPPENRTADPARLHGRLIHASHMAIAYMLLTPIGCFVCRYYKETFVTVFCFQEYWWYMWHVVTLIAACLFNVGAITSIARKKDVELVYNDNLLVHVIFGAISIFVFYMEIITGFFRVADPKKRMRQIFTHWLIGMSNNACAVMSMFAMAWVDQSGFSCNVAYTVTFWLIFVVSCYVIMELNMRKTDKQLKLVPRRTYLPPPVKRLFTREPPGRHFRLMMLGIFIFGLIIIQFFVSYYIWHVEGGASCEEEYRLFYESKKGFDYEGGAEAEEGESPEEEEPE